MRASLFAVTIASVATLGCFAPPAIAQQDTDQRFGTVHFETSCNEAAQRRFDRAMRYQHSFWYRCVQGDIRGDAQGRSRLRHRLLGHRTEPARTIRSASARRPICRSGSRRIQKAQAVGAKTPRERDYIECAWRCSMPTTTRLHHAHARAGLSQGDGGAGATLSGRRRGADLLRPRARTSRLRPPTRPTPISSRARRILEPIFQRQPQHPGVAHYLIHLYDYPAIAEKGLDAATRYSKIAPAAPHAQHMPSHIFTRVGYWKESICLQYRSGARGQGRQGLRRPAARPGLPGLRLSAARRRTRRRAPSSTTWPRPDSQSGRLPGAISRLRRQPARYTMERGDWNGAAQLDGRASQVSPCHGDHPFRPRARRGALRAIPTPPRPTSPSSPSCATSCATAKDAYWAETGRYPVADRESRGCFTPRANTTMRSKR